MSESQIKMVTLANGAEVPESLVVVTNMWLKNIMDSDPLLLLYMSDNAKAKDPEPFSGLQLEQLQKTGLLDYKGKFHQSVKDIVAASVEIDGFDIGLVNPLRKEGADNPPSP